MCRETQYGNTVLRSEIWPEYVRIMFSPVLAGSRVGVGVIRENITVIISTAGDFPVSDGSVMDQASWTASY